MEELWYHLYNTIHERFEIENTLVEEVSIFIHHYKLSKINISFIPFTDTCLNKTCAICLESFINTDLVSDLSCKHTFHKNCILEWAKRKLECPICRGKLPINNM